QGLEPGIAELDLCLGVRPVAAERENGSFAKAGVTHSGANAELLAAHGNGARDGHGRLGGQAGCASGKATAAPESAPPCSRPGGRGGVNGFAWRQPLQMLLWNFLKEAG